MYNSQCRCRFKLRRQHHFLLQLLDIIIVILRKLSHSFLLAYDDDDDKNVFFEYMQKKIRFLNFIWKKIITRNLILDFIIKKIQQEKKSQTFFPLTKIYI